MSRIEGNFLTHVKETVTVLRPMRSIYARGEAAGKHKDPTISLRIPPDDMELVIEAAKALDVPKTAFIRWCAVAVAKDIIRQKNEYDRQQ